MLVFWFWGLEMRHRNVVLGAVLGALLLGGGAANATLTFAPGERVVYLGTSITHDVGQGTWYGPAETQIDAAYTRAGTTVVTAMATATSSLASATVPSSMQPQNMAPTVFNAGVTGNTIAQMTARLNTDVFAHSPTIVVVEGSVNDIILGTSLGTYQTNTMALASAIRAGAPSAKVAWVGIFSYGESYPDTSWGSIIDSYNAANAAAAASISGEYVDVRTPQQAYESVHNTPPPGALGGILCADTPGVHPNASLGVPMYSTTFMAHVTLTGTPP